MAATSRNTETSQYLPHTIYHKNAAQQARRNPGDPRSHILQPKTSNIYANAAQQRSRPGEIQETHATGPRISHTPTYMHKQLQQHFQSTPTCISSNIYSVAQLIMVSTSTAQLLASQDINRLFRLCVHPGPVSSHVSQPLVASFDKTATAPQTEQVTAPFLPRISHEIIILFPIYTLMHVQSNNASIS
jgi:hypothetical protein